eukprot:COSAG06_NODE_246_length_19169_cov_28.627950_14_plen_118_part_00
MSAVDPKDEGARRPTWLEESKRGGCAQAAPASAKLGCAPRHEGSAGGEDLKLRKRRRAESLRHRIPPPAQENELPLWSVKLPTGATHPPARTRRHPRRPTRSPGWGRKAPGVMQPLA